MRWRIDARATDNEKCAGVLGNAKNREKLIPYDTEIMDVLDLGIRTATQRMTR